VKLLTVIGARPQFVKAAALTGAIRRRSVNLPPIHEVVVHTGQHYDYELSRVFFEQLPLPTPNYDLGVGSGLHGAQTGRMLERLEPIVVSEQPEVLLVYGDTNSTLAGALVGAKLHVPVAHVEAGLRSFNRRMPEEINRVLTDHVAEWLFCPTPTAVQNLAAEGIRHGAHLVGDVMYEMLCEYARAAAVPSPIAALRLSSREYALATVHRAENTDDLRNLEAVAGGLAAVARMLPVVLPLHPRTSSALSRVEASLPPAMHVIPPLGYVDMLAAEQHARLVLTDSGGVQKEAYWLGVPCVTLRGETEWVETLTDSRNVLAGADSERIEHAAIAQLSKSPLEVPEVLPTGAATSILHLLESRCR